MAFKSLQRMLLIGALALLSPTLTHASHDDYRILEHIAVPDARWDYAAVDPRNHRFYLGRFGGVLMLDLTNNKVTSVLVPSRLVHGVLPLPALNLVMSTNGVDNTVTAFRPNGEVVATIPVGRDPDAIVLEPRSGSVVTTNAGDHTLSLIDPRALRRVGTISLDGTPEALVPDGTGRIYDNLADRDAIAIVDVSQGRVVGTVPLPDCHEPTAIAHDARHALVVSVCKNGVAVFVSARDQKVIRTIRIGTGPDAAMFDARRDLLFIPSGGSGTLSVISLENPAAIHALHEIATARGTRTGALDPSTGRLYLPAARFPEQHGSTGLGSPEPGSFEILVIGSGER